MTTRAMITGAAGGLGRAVADALAARGCRLALVDIDAAALDAGVADCGPGAVGILCDLAAPDGPAHAVARATAALGGLDIVVNNAGFGEAVSFFALDAAHWDRTLALNLRAVALICSAAGRVMRAARSGRIVNITSPASRMALPDYLAYAASKAGVDAVTRAAALALAPFGVAVTSVAPGMMDTPLQRLTERQLAALAGRDDVDAFLAERTARIPQGRRTDPATVARAVVWLALDAPDAVTAERLNVSGGLDRD